MKTKLCLLYGGKSAEHEVSLQTAKAVIEALNTNKYEVYPIFITKTGKWVKGPELTEPVSHVKALQFEKNGEEIVPQSLVPIRCRFPLVTRAERGRWNGARSA